MSSFSFDIDIDALLAAESSEEDENLPDLGRSLEEILEDAWDDEEEENKKNLQDASKENKVPQSVSYHGNRQESRNMPASLEEKTTSPRLTAGAAEEVHLVGRDILRGTGTNGQQDSVEVDVVGKKDREDRQNGQAIGVSPPISEVASPKGSSLKDAGGGDSPRSVGSMDSSASYASFASLASLARSSTSSMGSFFTGGIKGRQVGLARKPGAAFAAAEAAAAAAAQRRAGRMATTRNAVVPVGLPLGPSRVLASTAEESLNLVPQEGKDADKGQVARRGEILRTTSAPLLVAVALQEGIAPEQGISAPRLLASSEGTYSPDVGDGPAPAQDLQVREEQPAGEGALFAVTVPGEGEAEQMGADEVLVEGQMAPSRQLSQISGPHNAEVSAEDPKLAGEGVPDVSSQAANISREINLEQIELMEAEVGEEHLKEEMQEGNEVQQHPLGDGQSEVDEADKAEVMVDDELCQEDESWSEGDYEENEQEEKEEKEEGKEEEMERTEAGDAEHEVITPAAMAESLPRRLTALQLAEEEEVREASSGLHWEEGAAAQPMRLEGIQLGPPAIGLLSLDDVSVISALLASPQKRQEYGMPQALATHAARVAVGMSKGAILISSFLDRGTHLEDRVALLGSASTSSYGALSALAFSPQGDLLLAGYASGAVCLWDIAKPDLRFAKPREVLGKGTSPALFVCFLGVDLAGSVRYPPRAITADARGGVLLHTFTVMPLVRRFNVATQSILDGKRQIPILSISPLLAVDGSNAPSVSTQALGALGDKSGPAGLGGVMEGMVGGVAAGMDVGKKFLYNGLAAAEEGAGEVVLVTHQMALIVRLLPSFKVCCHLERPKGLREGSIPYTAWRLTTPKTPSPPSVQSSTNVPAGTGQGDTKPLGATNGTVTTGQSRVTQHQGQLPAPPSGSLKDDVKLPGVTPGVLPAGVMASNEVPAGRLGKAPSDEKLLAMAWDTRVQIIQLVEADSSVVVEWELTSAACGVAWLDSQMLVILNEKAQLCLYSVDGTLVEHLPLEPTSPAATCQDTVVCHRSFPEPFNQPAFHNALSVRGAAIFVLGEAQLRTAQLMPWQDRIRALQDAGDWMGAFRIAMEVYKGEAKGVTGLPPKLSEMRTAVMPALLALLAAYIDEAFTYIQLALGAPAVPPGDSSRGNGSVTLASKKVGGVGQLADGGVSAGLEMKGGRGIPVLPEEEPSLEDEDEGRLRGKAPGNDELLSEKADTEEEGVVEEEGEGARAAREQYARVGGVAIEFLMHLGQTEILFTQVLGKFREVGQWGTFLELLEPYILKDMLGALAPEVMQGLVEHYARRGWLRRVELCICHMDIASLDFHQVVSLCRQHRLHSALIYLFSLGLGDFVSPLEELLAADADACSAAGLAPALGNGKDSHQSRGSGSKSRVRPFGYKLLVYLKYCFKGLAFPPGHGSLPPERLPSLRRELLECLLEPAVPVPQGPTSDGLDGSPLFPRLACLLALDTEATLEVLSLAFPPEGNLGIGSEGSAYQGAWYVRDQVRRIEGGEGMASAEDSKEIAVAQELLQRTVAAVMEVCAWSRSARRGSVGESSRDAPDGQGRHLATGPGMNSGAMLEFVARFVASGHARVPPGELEVILAFLVQEVDKTADLAIAQKPSTSSPQAFKNAPEDREGLVLAVLERVPGTEWDLKQVFAMAEKAHFWQVCAFLHERRGPHHLAAALACHLSDRHQPKQAFEFLRRQLAPGSPLHSSRDDWTAFRKTVLQNLPALTKVSSEMTLELIEEYFMEEQQQVLAELAPHPALQFTYLKALNTRALKSGSPPVTDSTTTRQLSPQRAAGPDIVTPGSGTGREQGPRRGNGEGLVDLQQRAGIVLTDDMVELYIELLCRFEPASVLHFLQSHDSYRLERCLSLCQDFGVADAAAFLLERMGYVARALALTLADLDHQLSAMDHAISRFMRNRARSRRVQAASGARAPSHREIASLGPPHGQLLAAAQEPLLAADPGHEMAGEGEAWRLREAMRAEDVCVEAVLLCQRNTPRLEPREAEALWFRLLHRFVKPLQELKRSFAAQKTRRRQKTIVPSGTIPNNPLAFTKSKGEGLMPGSASLPGGSVRADESKTSGAMAGEEEGHYWTCCATRAGMQAARKFLGGFAARVVEGMSGHIPLGTIVGRLVSEHSQDEFGDFRAPLLGLLGTLSFEHSILDTAKRLVEADVSTSIRALRLGRTRALCPATSACSICGVDLSDTPPSSSGKGHNSHPGINVPGGSKAGGVYVYSCRHGAHVACALLDPGQGVGGVCGQCRQKGLGGLLPGRRALDKSPIAEVDEEKAPVGIDSSPGAKLAAFDECHRSMRLAEHASLTELQLAPPRTFKRSQISPDSYPLSDVRHQGSVSRTRVPAGPQRGVQSLPQQKPSLPGPKFFRAAHIFGTGRSRHHGEGSSA